MKLTVCSIHDTKAEAWLNPLFFQSEAQAIRSFSDAVNDPNSEFSKHPEDYNLFVLGLFDQRTGELEASAPVHLITGVNVVNNGEV